MKVSNKECISQKTVGSEHSQDSLTQKLLDAGLRPTRQRMLLSQLLFNGVDRHFTADQLYHQCQEMGQHLSLATVYNNLNQFLSAGLVRQVAVGGNFSFFDTNVSLHHHFYHEENDELQDIPADQINVASLPTPPSGQRISEVEVLIRLKSNL